jgi:hypothetical protein
MRSGDDASTPIAARRAASVDSDTVSCFPKKLSYSVVMP